MSARDDKLELVRTLVEYLDDAAIKNERDNQEDYVRVRQCALDDPAVGPLLPEFVRKYRALGQFRVYMQSLGGYKVRSAYIHDAFEPVYESLEGVAAVNSAGSSPNPGAATPKIERPESVRDVFISYASEDRETFVASFAQALSDAGLTVWYDKNSLRVGDSLSRKIDEGLASAKYGVLVLSQNFFNKNWPEREYRALLALGTRLLPVYHGVSHADVLRYSPLLGDVFGLDSGMGVHEVASLILDVVKQKPAQAANVQSALTASTTPSPKFAEYHFAPYKLGDPGVPIDALPWQPVFGAQQPCLEISFGEPHSVDLGGNLGHRWVVNWTVENVGGGAARAVSIWLPCLAVDHIDSIKKDDKRESGGYCDDRKAFWSFLKPPLQAILEYEDVSGVLYRQYGVFEHSPVPSGAFYRFGVSKVGKPFRVQARIVPDHVPPSWIVPISRL